LAKVGVILFLVEIVSHAVDSKEEDYKKVDIIKTSKSKEKMSPKEQKIYRLAVVAFLTFRVIVLLTFSLLGLGR